MRAHPSRSAGLIAATGLALAVSPLALASAAGATATAPASTPTVSASPTSSPPTSSSPSSSPSPTKTPVKPPQQGTVDASVKIVHEVFAETPKSAIAKFVVKSTKPATGYRLTITMHKDLDWHAPSFNGWDCTGSENKTKSILTCDYPGEATTRPGYVGLSFEMPQTAGLKLDLSASVRTTEADSNLANNTVTKTIVVPADKPSAQTGALTGRVWNDANHNGRQDKGEKGVAGAKVLATFGPGDSTTKAYGPVTTGADGRYTIGNITPNVPGVSGFTFAVAAPGKAWSFTKYQVGAANGNSDFQFIANDDMPGSPYDEYFGKNAVIGLADEHTITAGKTLVLDAGLVKRASGAGDDDTLPKTGAAAGGLLGAGALLIGGGIALTALARRRRSTIA